MIAIVHLERGMPCKRESSTRAEYVPALCTHRPSLLPIGWSGELVGLIIVTAGAVALRKVRWTLSSRGRRSRNKVSVGEPAEGSLSRHELVHDVTIMTDPYINSANRAVQIQIESHAQHKLYKSGIHFVSYHLIWFDLFAAHNLIERILKWDEANEF